MLFKVQNIVDIRSAELVDRLIVITDHAQVFVFAREKTDQLKLRRVRILILVHHDIAETLLIVGKHLWICLQQLYRLYDEIVKIQRIILLQRRLILLVDLRLLFLCKITRCRRLQGKLRRAYKLVLCRGDRRQKAALLVDLGIDIQALADLLHDALGIIRIIDRKIRVVSDAVNVSP